MHSLQTFLHLSISHLHGLHPGGQFLQPSQEVSQQGCSQQSQVQPFLAHFSQPQGSHPGGQFLQLLQILVQASVKHLHGTQPELGRLFSDVFTLSSCVENLSQG